MAYWLGLDVGTTFSAAAVANNGRVEIVSIGNHGAAIPSLLFLRDDGTFLVGEAAGRRGLSEPERLARHFKRRFGDSTPLLLSGTPWSADALLSHLVRHLVAEVTAQLGSAPEAVAVTHPANWGPYKTDLLRQALRSADVGEVKLLTEPEAAAIYYASTERVEAGEVVAIYDLGGGTFDAAVLKKTETGFELLGEPEGIERLGGVDFDEAVMAHVVSFIGPELGSLDMSDPATLSATARLREDCVEAKEALSADTDVSIPVSLPNVQTELRLTRSEFEGMIRPTLNETTGALARALRSSGIPTAEIKAVLLVGGSSRIPLVGQMVAGEIGRPVAVDVHPKHAVAMGAALAAAASDPQPVVAQPVVAQTAVAQPAPAPAPLGTAPAPEVPPARPVPAAAAAGTVPPPAPPALPPPAAPTAEGTPPPKGRGRRLPLIIAAIAAAVVVVAGGIFVLTSKRSGGSAHPEVPTFSVPVSEASIAVGGGALWLGEVRGPSVNRFDLASHQVTTSISLGAVAGDTSVTFGAGAVWAANEAGSTVVRIDPATNAVTNTIAVGHKPHDVLFAAGAVWVTSQPDGVVTHIDPASGAATPILVRGQPSHMAFGAGALWVSDRGNNVLVRIDPATKQVVGEARTGPCPDYLAASDTAVWVQDNCKANTIYKVDPKSGDVVGTVEVGRDARWLTLAGGSLWVTNYADSTVSLVDVGTLHSVAAIRVGLNPFVVAAAGNDVWVSNIGDSTLSFIAGRATPPPDTTTSTSAPPTATTAPPGP